MGAKKDAVNEEYLSTPQFKAVQIRSALSIEMYW